jgi:hypothetical protein
MKSDNKLYLGGLIALSVSISPVRPLVEGADAHGEAAAPHIAAAHAGGGAPHMAAPQAPHMAAPHMAAPRMAAPHMAAPHMAAPHMEAPHTAAPHMEASHMAAPHMETSHMAAPHMETSHMVAPHMETSHMAAPHMEASHMAAPHMETSHMAAPHMEASHMVAPHVETQSHSQSARMEEGQAPRAEGRAEEGGFGGHATESEFNRSAAAHENLGRMNPSRSAAEYAHMEPQARDRAFNGMAPAERAQTISRMNPEERAESMYKMTPEQRAETMSHMSPALRSSFIGPAGEHSLGREASESARANAESEHQARIPGGAHVPGREGAGAVSRGSIFEHGNASNRIPGAPRYANPRHVGQIAGEPAISPHGSGELAWRGNEAELPHAGDARSGRAGAIDPGGYIRQGGGVSPRITPAFAQQQFASFVPNYAALANANAANMIGNPAAWPWTLPAYSPGWFSNWNGPWSWPNNWYNGGGWGSYGGFPPSWDPGYCGYGGILSLLANIIPWGLNSEDGWVPYLHYYSGYTLDGTRYPSNYYAPNGYTPTHYVFNVVTGEFYAPGVGYLDHLPADYTAPITVAVQESVPMYNVSGQTDGYKVEAFNYNAFWDANAQAYGFYNYRQQFQYLTFPWLSSWQGNYIEGG